MPSGTAANVGDTNVRLVLPGEGTVVEALMMADWVQKDAAELLSITPRVMNYKIKALKIEFPHPRRRSPSRPNALEAQLP